MAGWDSGTSSGTIRVRIEMTQTLRNCQPNVGHHHIMPASVTLSHGSRSLCSNRGVLNEKVRSTRWNMWTRLQLSRYAHYWQHGDRPGGNLFNEVFKVSRARGECLWIVLLVVTDSRPGYIPVFLIPCIHWWILGYGETWCWQRDRARVNRCQHQVVRTVSQESAESTVSEPSSANRSRVFAGCEASLTNERM